MRKIGRFGCLGLLALIVVIGLFGSNGNDNASDREPDAATVAVFPTFTPTAAPTATALLPPSATSTPGTATAAASLAGIPAGAVQAQLVKVVDGDTIDVIVDGRAETVRYVGIDTPERGQPGYRAAAEANRAILGGGPLYLVQDQSDRDRYGRLLHALPNSRRDGRHG